MPAPPEREIVLEARNVTKRVPGVTAEDWAALREMEAAGASRTAAPTSYKPRAKSLWGYKNWTGRGRR